MAKLRAKRGPATGRKRGPLKGYYAEFYDADRSPKQIRFSLKTKDEQTARAKLLRLERAFALGEFDPWAGDRNVDAVAGRSQTVTKAAEEYVEARRPSLAESSLQTDRYVLRGFDKTLPPGLLVAHVRREHVERYLGSVENPSTRNSYRERLRGFFRWASEVGLRRGGDVVPPKGKGRQERREKLPRFFSEAQLSKVMDHLSEDGGPAATAMRDVVMFAVGTGLRRGEICALRWDAVSLTDRVVRVSHTDDASPKSGRERTVPLVGDALSVVQRLAERRGPGAPPFVFPGAGGAKLNGGYLGNRFAEYRKRAEVRDGLTFHGLRHTFGSYAVMRGMDLYRLKEIMGHADIKTTMKYAKLRPASLRPDMERCFGGGVVSEKDPDGEKGKAALVREIKALREEVSKLRGAAEP